MAGAAVQPPHYHGALTAGSSAGVGPHPLEDWNDRNAAGGGQDARDISARMRSRLGLVPAEATTPTLSVDGHNGRNAEELADAIASLFNPHSAFTRLRPQDRPKRMMHLRPPPHARQMFKVVALVDGIALSVYDGVTNYAPGTTWYQQAQDNHRSGIYVYPSYEHCLKRDAESFPSDSVLLHAPRAIAVVKCWNDPSWVPPLCYGMKYSFSYVHVLHVRPFPVSWYSSTLCNEARPARDGGDGDDDDESSQAAAIRQSMHSIRDSLAHMARQVSPTGSRRTPREWARSSGGLRTPSSAEAARRAERAPAVGNLIRRQARTMALEDEVTQMEAQVARIRDISPMR